MTKAERLPLLKAAYRKWQQQHKQQLTQFDDRTTADDEPYDREPLRDYRILND